MPLELELELDLFEDNDDLLKPSSPKSDKHGDSDKSKKKETGKSDIKGED